MWIAGVMQGLMWRAVNADGTLTYSFVEVGGGHAIRSTSCACWAALLFLAGMLIMAYNMWKTIAGAQAGRCAGPIPRQRLTH